MEFYSIEGVLTEIFFVVDERLCKIKGNHNKLNFINSSIEWIKIMLKILNTLKKEIEESI